MAHKKCREYQIQNYLCKFIMYAMALKPTESQYCDNYNNGYNAVNRSICSNKPYIVSHCFKKNGMCVFLYQNKQQCPHLIKLIVMCCTC
jgi:hypothetical protein